MPAQTPPKKRSLLKTILLILAACLLLLIGSAALFVNSLFKDPDMSKLPAYYPFKSAQAREKYLEYYDQRARQWPVDSEERYVETSYGKTFVRVSGPPNAPALVLLPSANASSLIWFANVKGLSEHFRVYAVDNIYDVGRSINTKPFKRADDFTGWMDELFTGLALGDSVNLMGYSFGGWLSSRYALRHPERLRKLVLVAPPSTIIALPGEWAWRGIISALPHPYFMRRFLVNWLFEDLAKRQDAESRRITDMLITDATMSLKCYKMRMLVPPDVLTDGELREIKVPALFLVGQHEKIYPAAEAVKRLNAVAPQIRTEIIPNASHDLPISQTEVFDKKVIEFLEQ